MKKLMIMLAAVAMAASVQAASVSWSSVTMYNAEGAKVKASTTMFVYLLDQTAYNSLTDIWATYGDDVKNGGTTAANVGGTKSSSLNSKASVSAPNGTAVANTTYYAAVITIYGTGDDMKYYAEKASVTTGDDGNATYQFGAGALDTAAAAATAWQSAVTPGPGPEPVPEPTSGLLVLLGVAGLALRRRRA